jgi:hypothetical protein
VTRQIGIPLAAGLAASLLFLSLAEGLAVGIVLSYVAPLPLMAVGLGFGLAASVVASLVGIVAVAWVAGGVSALPFAVAAILPSMVVVRQALLWRVNADDSVEWYPPGLVLGWLTGVGMVLILIGAALIPGSTGGVQGWIVEMIGNTLEALAPTLPAEQRQAFTEWWAPLFPAMVAGSWLLMSVVNAVSAQGLLSRYGRNRRPSPAYRQLMLPLWLGGALVITGAVGVIAGGDLGYLARNMAVLTLVPFAFLGLAAVHQWMAGRANARIHLAMFYGVLFLVLAWAFVPIAGLGVVRFVMRFRRAPESGGGKEE